MKKYLKPVLCISAALFFVAGVAFAAPALDHHTHHDAEMTYSDWPAGPFGGAAVVSPDDLYAGMTYGDWSAVWWQYAIQTPYATIFSDDSSSSFDCSAGQTLAPVFFLVGGGSQTSTANRTCTVPRGKAIFFPIINSECSTLEPPSSGFHGDTEYELRTCVSGWLNPTQLKTLKVTVDGMRMQNLQDTRAQSPVFTFTSLDTQSILGFQGTGSSVSDGYWILLKPLPPGKHTIHFEGAAPDVGNYQSVTYHLTVP